MAAAVTVLVLVAGASTALAAPPPAPGPAPRPRLAVDRAATATVSTLIGTGTANDTGRRFGVEGTDLGSMFLHEGRLAMVFGDTYGGPPADPFFGVRHRDWRSNVLGWLDPAAPPGPGTRFTDMITDRPGHAKELLASKKKRGVEETVIPTYGLSVGSRMFLHYMSVKQFDVPGRWTLNSAGVAHSDDDGRTWTKDPRAVWPGTSKFGQVAYVRPADDEDSGGLGGLGGLAGIGSPDAAGEGEGDTVYVYGIPGGRYGGVSLARVPADRVAVRSAYEYRTATGWSADEASATQVVPGPVGELSVRWHPYHQKWIMMYLVDPTGEIVLRTADSPTGPWGEAQVVTTTKQYPDAYAPFLAPVWNDGPDLVFTMSQYRPYRVNLMRTRLGVLPEGAPLPPGVRTTPPGPTAPAPHRSFPFEHSAGGM